MTNKLSAVAILTALALIACIPNISAASGGQAPQPTGGIATVIGVDQPDNCLRIRSGPGDSYDIIGCANLGDRLQITGVWTSNDWAQLANNGWVYGPQIQTDLRPPQAAYGSGPGYAVMEEFTPDYDDWAYLPAYGYNTYWYGGAPIFLYNVAVWHRYHPWWRHHGYQAWWWKGGHHGRRAWNPKSFNSFVRAGGGGQAFTHRANVSNFMNRANVSTWNRGATTRSFRTGGSNISAYNVNRFKVHGYQSGNVNRFNVQRFQSGAANAFRGRTYSTPQMYRSGSANVFRSGSANVFRSGSGNAFRSQGFSTPHTFHGGNFSTRQFGGTAGSSGFRGPHIGGAGLRHR